MKPLLSMEIKVIASSRKVTRNEEFSVGVLCMYAHMLQSLHILSESINRRDFGEVFQCSAMEVGRMVRKEVVERGRLSFLQ